MVKKKIPVRHCLGCNEGKPKKELIRVVKTAQGEFFIDSTGKKNGRGAYICPNAECFKKARRAGRFERAFGCAIPDEIYEALEKELVPVE